MTIDARMARDTLSADWLEAQNERVQEAHRLKSLFLADLPHELRAPPYAVIGFVDVLPMRVEAFASSRYGPANWHVRRRRCARAWAAAHRCRWSTTTQASLLAAGLRPVGASAGPWARAMLPVQVWTPTTLAREEMRVLHPSAQAMALTGDRRAVRARCGALAAANAGKGGSGRGACA